LLKATPTGIHCDFSIVRQRSVIGRKTNSFEIYRFRTRKFRTLTLPGLPQPHGVGPFSREAKAHRLLVSR
jgi:hypothetical protein